MPRLGGALQIVHQGKLCPSTSPVQETTTLQGLVVGHRRGARRSVASILRERLNLGAAHVAGMSHRAQRDRASEQKRIQYRYASSVLRGLW